MGSREIEAALVLAFVVAVVLAFVVGKRLGRHERNGESEVARQTKTGSAVHHEEARRPYRSHATSSKVLIIDHDAASAAELRHELTLLGCAVVVVVDGDDGLRQAASDLPDLVLLSVELRGASGFSVCNRLKKDPQLRHVPVVMMSAQASDETLAQHQKLRTRADHYVRRPIALDELLRRVGPLLPTKRSATPG